MVMMRGCSVGTARSNVLVAYPTERAGNAVDRRYATFITVSSMARTQLLGDVRLAGAQVVVAFMIRHLHGGAHGSRAQALRGDVAAARVRTHRGLASEPTAREEMTPRRRTHDRAALGPEERICFLVLELECFAGF